MQNIIEIFEPRTNPSTNPSKNTFNSFHCIPRIEEIDDKIFLEFIIDCISDIFVENVLNKNKVKSDQFYELTTWKLSDESWKISDELLKLTLKQDCKNVFKKILKLDNSYQGIRFSDFNACYHDDVLFRIFKQIINSNIQYFEINRFTLEFQSECLIFLEDLKKQFNDDTTKDSSFSFEDFLEKKQDFIVIHLDSFLKENSLELSLEDDGCIIGFFIADDEIKRTFDLVSYQTENFFVFLERDYSGYSSIEELILLEKKYRSKSYPKELLDLTVEEFEIIKYHHQEQHVYDKIFNSRGKRKYYFANFSGLKTFKLKIQKAGDFHLFRKDLVFNKLKFVLSKSFVDELKIRVNDENFLHDFIVKQSSPLRKIVEFSEFCSEINNRDSFFLLNRDLFCLLKSYQFELVNLDQSIFLPLCFGLHDFPEALRLTTKLLYIDMIKNKKAFIIKEITREELEEFESKGATKALLEGSIFGKLIIIPRQVGNEELKFPFETMQTYSEYFWTKSSDSKINRRYIFSPEFYSKNSGEDDDKNSNYSISDLSMDQGYLDEVFFLAKQSSQGFNEKIEVADSLSPAINFDNIEEPVFDLESSSTPRIKPELLEDEILSSEDLKPKDIEESELSEISKSDQALSSAKIPDQSPETSLKRSSSLLSMALKSITCCVNPK